jgi:hypothetical protein
VEVLGSGEDSRSRRNRPATVMAEKRVGMARSLLPVESSFRLFHAELSFVHLLYLPSVLIFLMCIALHL